MDNFDSISLNKERKLLENKKINETIKNIINDCMKQIRFYHTNGSSKFIYEIPIFYYNLNYNDPEYIENIILKVKKLLQNKKFKVLYVYPYKLIIEW